MVTKICKTYVTNSPLFSSQDSNHAIVEEDMEAVYDEEEDSDSNNNLPKGIIRISCKYLHFQIELSNHS